MKNGFTKIELLVVFLLFLAAIAFDIVFILYLNQKDRDIAVLSDIKQIQSALDVYYFQNSQYPVEADPVSLNDVYAGTEKLCFEGFRKISDQCRRQILNPVPNSGFGSGNIFKYQSYGQDYKIEFFLDNNFKDQGLSRGLNCATNNKILSQPCF